MTGNAFLIDDWFYIRAVIHWLSGKKAEVNTGNYQQSCNSYGIFRF
jgi:hypothetical protein